MYILMRKKSINTEEQASKRWTNLRQFTFWNMAMTAHAWPEAFNMAV
jgi:hypothetical protein